MKGTVHMLSIGADWGFVLGEDTKKYFFHLSNVDEAQQGWLRNHKSRKVFVEGQRAGITTEGPESLVGWPVTFDVDPQFGGSHRERAVNVVFDSD